MTDECPFAPETPKAHKVIGTCAYCGEDAHTKCFVSGQPACYPCAYSAANWEENTDMDHSMRQKIDRPWSAYPVGTKAHSAIGGHWTKTKRGWKWCTGATFQTPGGDAISVTVPVDWEKATNSSFSDSQGCY